MRAAAAAAIALLVSAPVSAAPPPNLVGARVETHDASAGLGPLFARLASRTGAPAWIGYAAPLQGTHTMCCWSSTDGIGTDRPGCRLESEKASFNMKGGSASALDGDTRFVVLFRVAGGRPEHIRTLSWSCGVDAGGKTVHWLENVDPAQSLALLAATVAEGPGSGKKGRSADNGAMAAVAFHRHPEADAVLDRLAAPSQPLETRRQAVFWMGAARDRAGYERLRRIAREDADPELREHTVFALAQSELPEAVDVMLEVARKDASREVRGQALFWLGQKAGRKAVEGIARAMDDDPDTEVREKAVFALSQLPADEGIPLLIRTARTHRDPRVREKAMFWLGQSGDPRALEFFAEVLAR